MKKVFLSLSLVFLTIFNTNAMQKNSPCDPYESKSKIAALWNKLPNEQKLCIALTVSASIATVSGISTHYALRYLFPNSFLNYDLVAWLTQENPTKLLMPDLKTLFLKIIPMQTTLVGIGSYLGANIGEILRNSLKD